MTALTIYSKMNEMHSAAAALHQSGFFSDVKSQAQALVKVMAGAELGLAPFASMSGIHIVQGKPVLGANLIATLVKSSGRYDYRVKQADNTACVLTWYEQGKAVGESSFTMAEANAAGLTNKPTWKAYASDMLFARALTRGARRYAPSIFGGSPIYTPEELGVDVDEDGHIVDAVVVEQPPAKPTVHPALKADIVHQAVTVQEAPPARTPVGAELADDELVIREAEAVNEFFQAAAEMLHAEESAVKARLRELGYTAIPKDAARRIDMYRKLKAAMSAATEAEAVQDDLFSEVAQSAGVQLAGAYAE